MAEIVKHKNPIVDRFVRENLAFTADEFLKFQDPTLLGFKLMFNFNDQFGLLDQTGSINSALGYLRRIGDTTRAIYLEEFISLFRQINQKTPWYFQTIEGLPDLWNRNLMEVYKEDRQIAIGCLESLDLRITGMIDLYRKACFDWRNRREVVPENLRRFEMMVYVYDWRIFNDFETLNGNLGAQKRAEQSKLFGKDLMQFDEGDDLNIGRTASRFLFKLKKCELLANESNAHLEAVSNPEGNIIAQKLVVNYFDFEEENVYTQYLNGKVSDNLLQALDNAALDVQPPIFASPIDGNNQAGFYPNVSTNEGLESRTFLESITNEAQEALLSNLLEVLPPGSRIFDESSLINFAGQQLNDLLGSAVGQALLANTDIFADSPSLGNIGTGNIGEINDDEAINSQINIDDEIEETDFNLSSQINEIIDGIPQNNISTIDENLEGAVNPLSDNFGFELGGGSLSNGQTQVNDSIESNDFGLSSQINETLMGEASIFSPGLSGNFEEAQIVSDDIIGGFNPAQNLSDDLELNLNEAETLFDEISSGIELGNAIANQTELVEDIISGEALVSKDNLEGDFKEAETGIIDLKGDLNEAVTPVDEIDGTLEAVIPKLDNLELLFDEAKTEPDDFNFEITEAKIVLDNFQFELNPANILIESVDFGLFEAPVIKGNLETIQKEAEIFNEDLEGNFKSAEIIKGNLDIISRGESINNKTQELNEIGDFIEVTGLSIELTESEKITGNAKIIDDGLNNIQFGKAKVEKDSLDGGMSPAVNREDALEETKLDPYNPNFINPEKDCND